MRTIETPDDFLAWRSARSPVSVASGKRKTLAVPCVETLLVARGLVTANRYNPNHVPKDKMRLLRQSILDNGFCFPVVTIWDDAEERLVIVDGFHRYTIATESWLDLSHIPAVVLDHDISARMYATVQFNKARGVHQVDLDADVIRALIEQGQTEEEIAVHLGIDLETIHRYKQMTGIAELFAKADYSMPWTALEALDAAENPDG
jgi:ParB-like chromosome segregation protein Spo0J